MLEKLFEGVGQGLRFESCRVGIDSTNNNTGFFALIDSSATNTQILWNAADSPMAQGSLVVENVVVDASVGSTVTAGNKSVLTGSVLPGKSWIWGNVYSSKDSTRAQGKIFESARAASLVDGAGAYHTVKPPTFQEYSHCEVVNVKNVAGWPVAGDGKTDEYAPTATVVNQANMLQHKEPPAYHRCDSREEGLVLSPWHVSR